MNLCYGWGTAGATLSEFMLAQGTGTSEKVKRPAQKTETYASNASAKPVWLASESDKTLPSPVPKVERKMKPTVAKPKPQTNVGEVKKQNKLSTDIPISLGKTTLETSSSNDDDGNDNHSTTSSGATTPTEQTYAQIASNLSGEEVVNLKPPRRKAVLYTNFDDSFEDESGTRQLRDFHGGLILPSKDFRRRGQAERKQMRSKGY